MQQFRKDVGQYTPPKAAAHPLHLLTSSPLMKRFPSRRTDILMYFRHHVGQQSYGRKSACLHRPSSKCGNANVFHPLNASSWFMPLWCNCSATLQQHKRYGFNSWSSYLFVTIRLLLPANSVVCVCDQNEPSVTSCLHFSRSPWRSQSEAFDYECLISFVVFLTKKLDSAHVSWHAGKCFIKSWQMSLPRNERVPSLV